METQVRLLQIISNPIICPSIGIYARDHDRRDGLLQPYVNRRSLIASSKEKYIVLQPTLLNADKIGNGMQNDMQEWYAKSNPVTGSGTGIDSKGLTSPRLEICIFAPGRSQKMYICLTETKRKISTPGENK